MIYGLQKVNKSARFLLCPSYYRYKRQMFLIASIYSRPPEFTKLLMVKLRLAVFRYIFTVANVSDREYKIWNTDGREGKELPANYRNRFAKLVIFR